MDGLTPFHQTQTQEARGLPWGSIGGAEATATAAVEMVRGVWMASPGLMCVGEGSTRVSREVYGSRGKGVHAPNQTDPGQGRAIDVDRSGLNRFSDPIGGRSTDILATLCGLLISTPHPTLPSFTLHTVDP